MRSLAVDDVEYGRAATGRKGWTTSVNKRLAADAEDSATTCEDVSHSGRRERYGVED